MHNLCLPPKSRLYSIFFALALIAVSCTDPNLIKGPNNITGIGTGNNTSVLPGWNGVDVTQTRELSNGVVVSSLAVSGGNIGRLFIPDTDTLIGLVQFHRLMQSPSVYGQALENNELGITSFIAERLKTKIAKVEINVAERTFPVTPFYFQGTNANGVAGISGEFSSLFPGARLPQGRLTANVYFDSLQLTDNVMDIPATISVILPRDAASIQRSSGLTIELAQALSFVSGEAHCEITLFSTFGIGGSVTSDIPNDLRRMAGSSVGVTPNNSTDSIPRGAGVGGKVINKILLSGTQRIVIPAQELQALPAGKCAVMINLTTVKRNLTQHFILAATSTSEFGITLK